MSASRHRSRAATAKQVRNSTQQELSIVRIRVRNQETLCSTSSSPTSSTIYHVRTLSRIVYYSKLYIHQNVLPVFLSVCICTRTSISPQCQPYTIKPPNPSTTHYPCIHISDSAEAVCRTHVMGSVGGYRLFRYSLFYSSPIRLLDVKSTVVEDRKSTRLNSSHSGESRMPSSA